MTYESLVYGFVFLPLCLADRSTEMAQTGSAGVQLSVLLADQQKSDRLSAGNYSVRALYRNLA